MRLTFGQADTALVIQEQPGRATLLSDQDGGYAVTDGDGNEVFTGGEVGAELAYWKVVLGVPMDEDSEVSL